MGKGGGSCKVPLIIIIVLIVVLIRLLGLFKLLKTNQRLTSAKTMMTHSLNKEASLVLCDAMRCRVEDGDAAAENWEDSHGDSLPADRFWNISSECNIAANYEGPCMGIELNIWERAKTTIAFIRTILIIAVIAILSIDFIKLAPAAAN